MTRLVLLVTSPRVPAGLLSAEAWSALRAGPVLTADPEHPQRAALAAAGIAVTLARSPGELVIAAERTGTATWLAATENERDAFTADIEVVHGSWDPPGARLLDVVATMDRLRSAGGCPWDAAQNHETLAPYLLEEAYEAFQAIEDRDLDALRDELGDVLLQVAFHARLAQELSDDERWSIDDVATGLVDKLIRRHPHVFADVEVRDAEEVNANWEAIKAEERGGASAIAGVPFAAPALTLAATLQRKAARLGVAPQPPTIAEIAGRAPLSPSFESAGDLLWAIVASLQGAGIDAEAALRARARAFRDRLLAAETPRPLLREGRQPRR